MMIKTVFRSEDLPPQDRLARLNEFHTKSFHPIRVSSEITADFRTTVRALQLAAVNVLAVTSQSADVQRTPKLIRESDPEVYSITFPLRGEIKATHAGRDGALGAGELVLYDSSRSFHARIAADQGTARLVHAHVPRVLLPLPADKVDRLVSVPLSGRDGVGALLTQFLTSLTTDTGSYRPADASRLGTVALDLLTATLAHHLDADPLVPFDSHRRALLLRIQAFIQQHLHDPQLTPGIIAAAHHISVSYLHRLFQAHDTTISAWIRRQRLERARRDLTDPALRSVPVHRIAARWGFNDHATFTRAFRAAYDIPPKDYRHHALSSSA